MDEIAGRLVKLPDVRIRIQGYYKLLLFYVLWFVLYVSWVLNFIDAH